MRDRVILDAAKALFAEQGFEAVGVDQIGAGAGMTGPAIYRHFRGKDEILATLFDEAMDRLLTLTGTRLHDPMEDLRNLARGHAEFALTDRELLSIYAREERALTKDHRRRLVRRQRSYVARWTESLAACMPSRSEAQVEAAAYALIGMLLGASHWPRGLITADGAIDLLVDLVENAVTEPGSVAPQSAPKAPAAVAKKRAPAARKRVS